MVIIVLLSEVWRHFSVCLPLFSLSTSNVKKIYHILVSCLFTDSDKAGCMWSIQRGPTKARTIELSDCVKS